VSLVSARKIEGGIEVVLECDVCEQRGEGRMDLLVDEGWFMESLSMTPHCCPACAVIRRDHLHGKRTHARQPPLPGGEIPRPC
jgi:hypothetical protein